MFGSRRVSWLISKSLIRSQPALRCRLALDESWGDWGREGLCNADQLSINPVSKQPCTDREIQDLPVTSFEVQSPAGGARRTMEQGALERDTTRTLCPAVLPLCAVATPMSEPGCLQIACPCPATWDDVCG